LHVLDGLPSWWADRAQAAGLAGRWSDLTYALDAASPGFIGSASGALLEGSAEEIGQRYVSALDPVDRAQNGRHYTPAPLAAELWAMAGRALGRRRPGVLDGLVRDPACGAGSLLLPALREHLGAAAQVDARGALMGLPDFVAGVDNDPGAVWLANVLLAAQMLPILARTERAKRRPLPALVTVGDGLAAPGKEVLVTIMNPPYGRVRLAPDERARFTATLFGHANLYGLFLAAGLEAVDSKRGVLAALVPTSFLAGRYYEPLRAALATQVGMCEVAFVADRNGSFGGVLQETCLAIFTRKRSKRVVIASINRQRADVATVPVPRRATPWLLPRQSDDAPVAAAALEMPLTLRSAGWKVSTGPLVWNRRRADLGREAGPGRLPVLWGADIDGGFVHRDRARDAMRYLKTRESGEGFALVDEPVVLVQRTTAPEQPRRLVVAPLTAELLAKWGGEIVVENHVNILRPVAGSTEMSVESLARLLGTRTVDRVLRCVSGSVAISAYELEALPLPDAQTLRVWAELDSEQLEQAVARVYRPPTP
jgi:adenine-specific DNA-methyltransferase